MYESWLGPIAPALSVGKRLRVEQRVQRRQAAGALGPAAERVIDHEQVVVAGDLLERLVSERLERTGLPRAPSTPVWDCQCSAHARIGDMQRG